MSTTNIVRSFIIFILIVFILIQAQRLVRTFNRSQEFAFDENDCKEAGVTST